MVSRLLPTLLHELANRVNTTGLAMQLLAESTDPPCPPEIRERLSQLRHQLDVAMADLHAMQALVRNAEEEEREAGSSSDSSAA